MSKMDIVERLRLSFHGSLARESAEEIERLRKLVEEAAEILEGDGEYPVTARRFRKALRGE